MVIDPSVAGEPEDDSDREFRMTEEDIGDDEVALLLSLVNVPGRSGPPLTADEAMDRLLLAVEP